jgi:hypothetical protein
MKGTVCSITLMGLLLVGGSVSMAEAQQSAGMEQEKMTMPKPGAEMAAVTKLFANGASWEGQVPAGALGPKSPATKSHGKAVCASILDGFWYLCEIEDTMGEGKAAMTWKGHMIVGYDLATKSYRGVAVDNVGAMTIYDGRMDGSTLTLETPSPVSMMGAMMKDRLTFVGGPDGMMAQFKDERQMGGSGPWMAFETVDHMTPLAAGSPGTTSKSK